MRRCTVTALVILILAGAVSAEDRFPRPDFESGYFRPTPEKPDPRSTLMEYVDVVALIVALAAMSVAAIVVRSRRLVFGIMVASLAYFGFYREGCVCPIGAIQNVALALFDSGYAIPFTAAAFFVLPLAATLLFGRTFCAGVCPLGAVQDLVLLRPLRVPRILEHALGMLPYVYLAAAVLFAATGSAFIICRYDPFVAIFRLSGEPMMWVLTGLVLLIAVFVGRPYCRYLCPYGVILRHFSRLAKWHVTITPDQCVKCRLCEDACPFEAISGPTPEVAHGHRRRGKGLLAVLILLLPVLTIGGALLARSARGSLARMHPTVRLAELVRRGALGLREKPAPLEIPEGIDPLVRRALIEAHAATKSPDTLLIEAIGKTGETAEALQARAEAIVDDVGVGAGFAGGFLALAFGLKLIQLSLRRKRTDFQADRALCVSCARCFEYCPREQLRLTGRAVSVRETES